MQYVTEVDLIHFGINHFSWTVDQMYLRWQEQVEDIEFYFVNYK